jgi:hypothetical protein
MNKTFAALSLALASLSLNAMAADLPASHCEIFVDKASAWSSSYGYAGVTLKIKTLNDRLDGAIKQVGYRSIVRSTPEIDAFCKAHPASSGWSHDCATVGVWTDRVAQPFFGPDYFKIQFELKHMYTFEHVFEGAFFVETDKGTRYWLNPSGGGDFFIDRNMRQDLLNRGSGGYYPQGKELVTADVFPYLNPAGCR